MQSENRYNKKDERKIALDILCRIDTKGRFADILFDEISERKELTGQSNAFIRELVYGILRIRGNIDWRIEKLSQRNIKRLSPKVRNILRLGIYQLLFMNNVPPFAAVNETVNLTIPYGGKRLRNFVNALLRKVAEEQGDIRYQEITSEPSEYISVKYSHPEWMVKRWIKIFGTDKTISLCKDNNTIPPITLRTNTILTNRERLVNNIKDEVNDLYYCNISPVGLIIKPDLSIKDITSYKKGWFYVQDEGSQLVSFILDPQPGEKILDICAAPGGKTTQIAELMKNQGEIIAADINQNRISTLRENIKRLKIDIIRICQGDAASSDITGVRNPDIGEKRFDRILVDAPCSGLGILRRHPEGKWQKKEPIIKRYKDIQYKILNRAASLLKSGGIIVYSTCTIEREENEDQIERFLTEHPEFNIEEVRQFLPLKGEGLIKEGLFLSTINNRWRMDNIFAARLIKN
ncbi:MAG: 16S rRNA (cytosine(967)-C(5))-methyltransferase RsmB [Nitrospirota bacterium]